MVKRRLEEGPKAEIQIDLLKTTLRKYLIGKPQAMMENMDYFFKKFTTTHDILALAMNRCLQEAHVILQWNHT